MKEKIIYCSASGVGKEIQPLLDQGWKVKHMVAESVSTSVSITTATSHGRDTYERETNARGYIVIVLTT